MSAAVQFGCFGPYNNGQSRPPKTHKAAESPGAGVINLRLPVCHFSFDFHTVSVFRMVTAGGGHMFRTGPAPLLSPEHLHFGCIHWEEEERRTLCLFKTRNILTALTFYYLPIEGDCCPWREKSRREKVARERELPGHLLVHVYRIPLGKAAREGGGIPLLTTASWTSKNGNCGTDNTAWVNSTRRGYCRIWGD